MIIVMNFTAKGVQERMQLYRRHMTMNLFLLNDSHQDLVEPVGSIVHDCAGNRCKGNE